MQIEDNVVLHIAKLARLKLDENELENYKKNLQEILDFADTIKNVNTDNIGETIGINENAPSQDEGMFRIPKVIN